ncbi:hypothetical protein CEUSTIGMA_g6194.t1 [Chlamydomonas eustigma]|uniref:histidine kinase n=1 Tax=Chlamydomonas eustigma TaxID=1157962 RepID=A0A250X6R1_9CHLO|nr:hypothetical protein CEUSTIGMA_g6194.t1 [Chlamydomonas eustigma]|eukprot:GAX78757.1 hypothetical protein CEUSTIGMA_g6194.t1 [Chlamydomonas eustigma]
MNNPMLNSDIKPFILRRFERPGLTHDRKSSASQKFTPMGTVLSSSALIVILCLAASSFAACALVLYWWMQEHSEEQERLHALLSSQVPSVLFALPISAFAGVLLLNSLNLPHSTNDTRFKSNLVLLYINVLALVTDVVIYYQLTPVLIGGSQRITHPLRYIQWSHSTPTMVYMLSLMSDMSPPQVFFVMVNDVSMMVTGLAATLSMDLNARVGWGAVSFLNFFIVMLFMSKMVLSAMRESADLHSRLSLRSMLWLMLVLWSSYPAIWLLAECNLMSPSCEQLMWGVTDYMAKAVFTSQLWQTNMKSVQERREAALAAWEVSNRSMVVDKLQQLVEAKDNILQVMSQELKTPLMGIIGLVNVMLKDTRSHPASGKEHAKNLTMVRSVASCLLNVVNGCLEESKSVQMLAEENKDQVEVANTETGNPYNSSMPGKSISQKLHPLADEVVLMLSPLLHEGVKLLNEVPEDIPEVIADRTKLTQILFNLIGNAVRFTHAGYIKVGAVIGCVETGIVDIFVVDTGPGISTAKQQDIFKPYDQGASGKALKQGGMGMGLYLVSLALQSMSSEVRLQSAEGQGSTFSFQLPILSEQEEAESLTAGIVEGGPSLAQIPTALAGCQCNPANDGLDPSACMSAPPPPSSTLDGHAGARQSDAMLMNMKRVDSSPLLATGRFKMRRSSIGPMAVSNPRNGVEDKVTNSTKASSLLQRRNSAGPWRASDFDAARQSAPLVRAPNRYSNSIWQILSVDDDLINQVVAEQVIKKENWQMVKAFDGLQALDYIESKSQVLPDLILLDIMMPNMNGYELCMKLREKYPSSLLPIIMLSAKGREDDVVQGLRCGADDYLVKPFKRAELVERIRAHLRSRDTNSFGFEALAAQLAGPDAGYDGEALAADSATSCNDICNHSSGSCNGFSQLKPDSPEVLNSEGLSGSVYAEGGTKESIGPLLTTLHDSKAGKNAARGDLTQTVNARGDLTQTVNARGDLIQTVNARGDLTQTVARGDLTQTVRGDLTHTRVV